MAPSTAPATTPDEAPPASKGPGLPAVINLLPWADPVIDKHGHDPRSAYVETFWLPVLGPSSTWLLRRFATGFDHSPDGFSLDCAQMSQELGLGSSLSRNASFVRSVDRCVKFGFAQLHADMLYVRRRLAPLAPRQVRRLPERLSTLHEAWTSPEASHAEFDQLTERARRLALTLVELGETVTEVERQLHSWQFHPAIAFEAASWAAAAAEALNRSPEAE